MNVAGEAADVVLKHFPSSQYFPLILVYCNGIINSSVSYVYFPCAGLILYNSQRAGAEDGDFVSFGMSGGHAEFRFNVGSGPAVIRSREPLELNAWHTVKLSRNRKEGKRDSSDDLYLVLVQYFIINGFLIFM